AVDDGQAGGDQREKRAEHQPVEALRNEVGPVDQRAPQSWRYPVWRSPHAVQRFSVAPQMRGPGFFKKQPGSRVCSASLACCAAPGTRGYGVIGSGVIAELAAEGVRLL